MFKQAAILFAGPTLDVPHKVIVDAFSLEQSDPAVAAIMRAIDIVKLNGDLANALSLQDTARISALTEGDIKQAIIGIHQANLVPTVKLKIDSALGIGAELARDEFGKRGMSPEERYLSAKSKPDAYFTEPRALPASPFLVRAFNLSTQQNLLGPQFNALYYQGGMGETKLAVVVSDIEHKGEYKYVNQQPVPFSMIGRLRNTSNGESLVHSPETEGGQSDFSDFTVQTMRIDGKAIALTKKSFAAGIAYAEVLCKQITGNSYNPVVARKLIESQNNGSFPQPTLVEAYRQKWNPERAVPG